MLIRHDGVVHHPLGAGSYVYKTHLIQYMLSRIKKKEIIISIGAQPNSSPHIGTIIVFCLAFALGRTLSNRNPDLKISVLFEAVDTAPQEIFKINGITYQKSLRNQGKAEKYLIQFSELLSNLSRFSGIGFRIRRQEAFNRQPTVLKIIDHIIRHKDWVASILDPELGLLRVRIACPRCGLTDKKGIQNVVSDSSIKSYCPVHGWFEVKIRETGKLEFNTPLRNLVRSLVYLEDNRRPDVPHEWIRVTGSDYAGFYQEQLLYRCVSFLGYDVYDMPMIVYAPLVLDWSGAKLSKSIYVKGNAYSDLPSYLLGYDSLVREKGVEGLEKLYREVLCWVEEPYKLFRHYTVYYFMKIFEQTGHQGQVIPK